MSTLTEVKNELTKRLEHTSVPKPVYAVAGAGELAYEKLRDVEKRVRELHLERRVNVRGLPASVVDAAIGASGRAGEVYEELSTRGKKLVDGFGSQRAVSITDAAPAKSESQQNGTKATTATAGTTKSSSTKTGSTKAKSGAAKKTAAKKSAAKKS